MVKLFVIGAIEKNRPELFPLLKPFIKNEGFTDEERIQLYGLSEKDFSLVNSFEEANYLVLPMSWNYYEANNKTAEINQLIQQPQFEDKKILSFTSGDFGVKTPTLKNLFVFRCNGEKSKLSRNNLGMPVIINDPLQKWLLKMDILTREYNKMPTIGFCGQANGSFSQTNKEIIQTFVRNVKFHCGFRNLLPQPLLSTSSLRYSLLQKFLNNNNNVITNFIFRKKYRAGAKTKNSREITTQEFYNNLNNSDYILCIRGGGNFSVRFYETLAVGRIPIFVDTDCLLPLYDTVNWKEHCVWIDYSERKNIVEKTLEFHRNLTADSFKKLQNKNRKLWQEKLTLGGFFKEVL